MAKKTKKNAEPKVEQQAAPTTEGVTTEEKKALENSPVNPDPAPAPETGTAEKVTFPEYPGADFCMDPTGKGPETWASSERIFDASNGVCKKCAADYADVYAACMVRNTMLGIKASKSTGARKAGAPRSRDGKPAQTTFIDDLIKQGVPIKEIGEKLAASHYGGVVKSGSDRTSRHVKSIRDGSYIKAAEMKPYLAAYDKKPEQPAATAATN